MRIAMGSPIRIGCTAMEAHARVREIASVQLQRRQMSEFVQKSETTSGSHELAPEFFFTRWTPRYGHPVFGGTRCSVAADAADSPHVISLYEQTAVFFSAQESSRRRTIRTIDESRPHLRCSMQELNSALRTLRLAPSESGTFLAPGPA